MNHNDENLIPKDWEWKKIGEIVTFEYGKSLRRDRRADNGIYRVFGSNGIVGYHDAFLVKEPCLIIGRKGAAGVVHVSTTPCWPIDTTYYVIPQDNINLFYLYYCFSNLNLGILDRSTAIPGLNRNDAYSIKIPVPPLEDQERIVAKIESLFTQLDAGVAGLKRAQAALKRYRASVLKAACEGRLVPQDSNDEPAEELLKRILADKGKKYYDKHPIEHQRNLPKGWIWAYLPTIGEMARGKSKYRPRNASILYDGKYPFIQTGEIRRSKGTINSFIQTYNDFGLKQSHLWPNGTLCITIAANIAETAVLNINACFPDSVVGFIPYKGVSVRYTQAYLNMIKEDLQRFAPATAQKNINIKVLDKLLVPIPPKEEQLRIVDQLEHILSVVEDADQKIIIECKRAERLRQSILKRAFEGRLL